MFNEFFNDKYWNFRYRFAVTFMVLVMVAAFTFAMVFVHKTQAYSNPTYWEPWSDYAYVPISDKLCTALLKAFPERRFVKTTGTNVVQGCRVATRQRVQVVFQAGAWQISEVQVQSMSPLLIYAVKIRAIYRYDGFQVFTDGSHECTILWAVGVEAKNERCETWNDGGVIWGFAKVRSRWHISLVHDGVPIAGDLWQEINIFPDGRKCDQPWPWVSPAHPEACPRSGWW